MERILWILVIATIVWAGELVVRRVGRGFDVTCLTESASQNACNRLIVPSVRGARPHGRSSVLMRFATHRSV
jgi:hypothetical protein